MAGPKTSIAVALIVTQRVKVGSAVREAGKGARRASSAQDSLHRQKTEMDPIVGFILFSGRVRYGLSNPVRAEQRRSRLWRRESAIPPSPPASQAFE